MYSSVAFAKQRKSSLAILNRRRQVYKTLARHIDRQRVSLAVLRGLKMRTFTTATALTLVAATHVAASRVSPKPATSSWNTYTVSHTEGSDDVPALTAALSSGNITANTTILFKKGTTYNIWSAIQFPTLNNVEVAIEGNLTYPESITDVQSTYSIITNVDYANMRCRCRCELGKLIHSSLITLPLNTDQGFPGAGCVQAVLSLLLW